MGNQARDRVMTRKFFSEAQTPWLLSKRVTPDREACSGSGVFLPISLVSGRYRRVLKLCPFRMMLCCVVIECNRVLGTLCLIQRA